jgi:hypothetical protein
VEKYQSDHCGLSWLVLRDRALLIAESKLSGELLSRFKASAGWLNNVLKRNDLVGVKLHGEGGEINLQEAEETMKTYRLKLSKLIKDNDISLDRIFNADQTGLFYQKLPNRVYCDASLRESIRGVKQMKDKNRYVY